MRPITLHPVSILVGTALVGAFMLVSSATQAPTVTQGAALARPVAQVPLTITGPVTIDGVPTPDQMMRVEEGSPYMVPAGKLLVITGLCASDWFGETSVNLSFNGSQVLEVRIYTLGGANGNSIQILPAGMTAVAGTTVTALVSCSGGCPSGSKGVALGYLVDA